MIVSIDRVIVNLDALFDELILAIRLDYLSLQARLVFVSIGVGFISSSLSLELCCQLIKG
jgi:hypothetical protein